METVGVRELRQNLSVYLRRVLEGETLKVTERGKPVAVLAPLPERATPLKRLIAEGKVTAPRGSLADLGPPPGPVSTKLTDALMEDRASQRY
jgi:prevent-host-death family protein